MPGRGAREGEARLRNKRMRQNLVRNEKELQALSNEVDSLKENNQRVEGELLVMMEAAGPRLTKIKELSEALATGRLEKLLPDWSLASGAVYWVTPPGGPRPKRVEVLADFLTEKLAPRSKRGAG